MVRAQHHGAEARDSVPGIENQHQCEQDKDILQVQPRTTDSSAQIHEDAAQVAAHVMARERLLVPVNRLEGRASTWTQPRVAAPGHLAH